MDQDEFNDFVRRKPFRPYRVTISDGRTYEIDHPEMAVVGFGSVIVGLPPEGDKAINFERQILVSLMHVVLIEFIEVEDTPHPTDTNGKN